MLSATPIPTRPTAVRFRPRLFDLLMRDMSFEFANMSLRCHASRPQRATFTDLGRAEKHVKAPINAAGSLQPLTCRTNVGLRFGVILEIALLKQATPVPLPLQGRPQILHMRPNLMPSTGGKVLIGP